MGPLYAYRCRMACMMCIIAGLMVSLLVPNGSINKLYSFLPRILLVKCRATPNVSFRGWGLGPPGRDIGRSPPGPCGLGRLEILIFQLPLPPSEEGFTPPYIPPRGSQTLPLEGLIRCRPAFEKQTISGKRLYSVYGLVWVRSCSQHGPI